MHSKQTTSSLHRRREQRFTWIITKNMTYLQQLTDKPMTEHEKLKRICDEIGYNNFWTKEWKQKRFDNTMNRFEIFFCYSSIELNVREIIFTPEFKDTFEKELRNRTLYTDERQNQIDNWDRENYVPDEQIEMQCDYAMFWLLYNLHDPVTYLYNLLFNE